MRFDIAVHCIDFKRIGSGVVPSVIDGRQFVTQSESTFKFCVINITL